MIDETSAKAGQEMAIYILS